MTTNHTYTLWDLLINSVDDLNMNLKNGIEIPMIQRDYAQGRTDDKTNIIRSKFLKTIYDQLLSSQHDEAKASLELDFIYGYIKNDKFIPLDGQQRLTTLYLIYWYVFYKDGNLTAYLNAFKNFTYKTRLSSRDFFADLNNKSNLDKAYNIWQKSKEENGNEPSLIELLQDQSWFQRNWTDDPTIKSILVVLNDIQIKFHDIKLCTVLNHRPITFYLLNINEYGLSDSLYIKMNARGKSLSDFENFKAILEGIFNGVASNLKITFSNSIDKEWLDRFWKHSNESLKIEERSEVTGKFILNLITSVTEFLYYKNYENKIYTFNEDILNDIYKDDSSIQFLIDAFDNITSVDLDYFNEYFNDIYSNESEVGKVRVFSQNINCIPSVLKGGNLEHTEKLLFFAWLIYTSKSKSIEITSNLKDYLRLCRNFINNINQKNKRELDLTTELRTDYYHDIILTFIKIFHFEDVYSSLQSKEYFFRKQYISFEIQKASKFNINSKFKELIQRLEDHVTFKGLIYNIDLEKYNIDEFAIIVQEYYNLFDNVDCKTIIRLFLSIQDYSIKMADTNLGALRFLGKEEKWLRVMASPDGEIKQVLLTLFDHFLVKDSGNDMKSFIESLISKNLELIVKNSWRYYFIKYEKILDKSIFSITDKASCVPVMELFDKPALQSYHTNPFVWVVINNEVVKEKIIQQNCYAINSATSAIHLKNGLILIQENDYWKIINLELLVDNKEIIEKFKLDKTKDSYTYSSNDLIQDILIFIKGT